MSEHFKNSEFACKCNEPDCVAVVEPDVRLVERLEAMRDILNQSVMLAGGSEQGLVINSGIRCPEHNKAVGGSPTSSHLGGYAVDLKVSSAGAMLLYVVSALQAGFERIGVSARHGQPYFLHIDVDTSKQSAMWSY